MSECPKCKGVPGFDLHTTSICGIGNESSARPAGCAPTVERETADEALEAVESFGPWGVDLNEHFRRQIVLADEAKRLRKLYEMAVKGRQDMRDALREAREHND